MNKLVQPDRRDPQTCDLLLLLDTYKTEYELMCIQFLSGGWKLSVRDSVMALYQAREQADPFARESIDDLLIIDGETVRALLELAEARGPAELQVADAQLRRLRKRHTDTVFLLRHLFATSGA